MPMMSSYSRYSTPQSSWAHLGLDDDEQTFTSQVGTDELCKDFQHDIVSGFPADFIALLSQFSGNPGHLHAKAVNQI
jgi:hypothetical protein